MEYLKLIGILIVIIGFALKKDSILIIMCAAIVTALVGGLGIEGLLSTLGQSFVDNRSMAIFIIVMLVTGTLERNGLKQAAADLIRKVKGASAGLVIGLYGVMRMIFAAFNVSFGGVAGFVRPIIMPMATGAIEASGKEPNEEHVEELKGMASGMENITLVQSTLKPLGYEVDLLDLAKVEIPIGIIALIVGIVYYYLKDKKLTKKYYGNEGGKK